MKKALLLLIPILLMFACKKDLIFDNSSDLRLSFSTDTVLFDTVFTTVGSSTRKFTVRNRSKDAVKIDYIGVATGSSSKFRLNIDGVGAKELEDIEIEGGDSIFIFVDVTLDPNNTNNPLVITDSILFMFNNVEQNVKLIAWGQDAYFYAPDPGSSFYIFDCATTLQSDKPHVFFGYAAVDSTCELIINAGAQLHFHGPNSGMLIYTQGSLKVNGELDNEVVFQSDRLEPYFENLPGQWGRVWLFAGSVDNEINYAIIKNATIGIQCDTIGNANPTLKIRNSVIRNSSAIGLFGQGTHIEAENLLINNSGQHDLVLNIGGSYSFKHCTMGNYWNYGIRSTPSVVVNNWYEDFQGNVQLRDLTNAYFGNCIIYGREENELALVEETGADFNIFFENTIIKSDDEDVDFSDPTRFSNIKLNQNPKFINPQEGIYLLDTLSVAKDAGINALAVEIPFDLKGDSRASDAAPDLGCYERVE
ncbi:MAG: hypothetical protein ACI8ZO_001167 [Flavobacteriales bacterium]